MPPQIQALLQNRNMMIGIGAGLILIIALLIWHPWAHEETDPGKKKIEVTQRKIATVDSIGKAIEIQALLAREGIRLDREDGDGGKVNLLFGADATFDDRDRALITLVQSGLMDKNVGLESFDKGDLTASREEKKIKLIRAQQGELARLIRKIEPIEDASINLSIPEQTIFKSDQKPMSASVQVTIPNGERLNRDKVRSIINLIVGSVQGLDSQHVALSDTNGNTYNSVLDLGSELNDKLEEQDQYMKQKVSSQLDKLVGPGHYVVTVSTLLREAPKETMVQQFDPSQSAVTTKQNFSERLNSGAGRSGLSGGPVSSNIPSGVDASVAGGSAASRGYSRSGTEVAYANSKTQWIETSVPGMIEDISIAVTIDSEYFPKMEKSQLKELLAYAASPKVRPENVSIADVNLQRPSLINTSEKPVEEPKKMDWLLWALGSVALISIVAVFLMMVLGKGGNPKIVSGDPEQIQRTQQELQQLRDFAAQQQAQLEATQQQTQILLEAQQRQLAAVQQGSQAEQINQTNQLRQTLSELKETVEEEALEVDDLDMQIKSWIES